MAKLTRKHKVETRTIAVKVPVSLFEDLKAFRQELQEFDNTMILNINELIVTTLKRDLRTAREELKRLQETPLQPPAVMQTTADSITTAPSSATPPPTTTSSGPTAHKVHSA